jgi:hypothetical protein
MCCFFTIISELLPPTPAYSVLEIISLSPSDSNMKRQPIQSILRVFAGKPPTSPPYSPNKPLL